MQLESMFSVVQDRCYIGAGNCDETLNLTDLAA